MKYKNGKYYIGNWMDDKENGEGRMILANKDEYIG